MPFRHAPCRLSVLPTQLLIQVRLVSSTPPRFSGAIQQYPYPSNSRPTPYQIFHLSPGASQQDIKARYYELVRFHHPDSTYCRSLTPTERHARFQAIVAAYDTLRGKTSGPANYDPYREEVIRRKTFYQAHYNRRAEYARQHPNYARSRAEWTASADDRWKDRVIIIAGVISLAAGLAPGLFMSHSDKQHRSAVLNLRQARLEAREIGEERMVELRKRASDIKKQQEADRSTNSKDHSEI